MFEVYDGSLLVARGGNEQDIKLGRNFYSNPEEWMQWASFWYQEGDVMQPHIHKLRNHQGKYKTSEFFYIIRGCLRIDFYTVGKKFIENRRLYAGDFVCTYDGGHGFEIEAPDTKFLEIKHGKFTSVEDDRVKF